MSAAQKIAGVRAIAEAILPHEATPLEKALFCIELAALAEIDPSIVGTVWSPYACPKALLPWLAWAVSVDVWDDAWSEAKKRKVIAAAPGVHRIKGTVAAVKRALSAFDIEAEIVEWWQEEPAGRRGTFRTKVFYRNGGPIFSNVILNEADAAVRASKPKSRVATTQAIVSADETIHARGFARTLIGYVAQPLAFTGASAAGGWRAVAVPQSHFTHTAQPKAA